MFKDISAQSFFMGILVAFAGFASSFAVVLQGLEGVGATPAQAASGLAALSIAMGLCGIVLSLWSKMPISVAWSTPGAALLAGTGVVEGGFSAAVGAFLISSALIVAAGLFRPFGRAVASIPPSLSNAMLAGIVLPLCLAPVTAVGIDPLGGILIFAAWAVVGVFKRLWALPAALAVFVGLTAYHLNGSFDPSSMPGLGAGLVFVSPEFNLQALISIALPLFIVTMASQNIPGVAVLKVNGYEPAPGPLFASTGVFSLLSAPFGGLAVNLAAITAAMCAGADAHPDTTKRYWAAAFGGLFYILFGLATGVITWFVSLSDPVYIKAVAGLALIGALTGAATAAFSDPRTREAAGVTFLVTASGLSFGGVSGAFWGLIAGGAVLAMNAVFRKDLP
ncbi:benzoate/H(+) symporter BenE family transporter [Rhizobium sp. L1K21]|uniref:benzoate/H(+) symporter BenE family transporter n=1 Tax=Rhizobium sp. L1K21 TaxID=2954933 RepID=UPI002092094F|nr:benzoate/H(+) symporter BenE family transporter [Rhizobium sp. L1K21]MCO6185401.1 benzoate/H(+) symporter BenE family transporter [Rhizobium sp. L1K21]